LSLKTLRPILAVLLILALAATYLLLRREGNTAADASEASASLIPLLADESSLGFARATVPGAVEFPRDLGTHDEYQTEWWYYTGNLETAAGEQFGFQLTFFRRALPVDPDLQGSSLGAPQSDWRTNQVYLAHFTVSDIGQNAFYPAERFSRGAAGLAGAQASPYRVWLENWSVEEQAPGSVRLRASTDDVALDLTLTETLPPVLHGDGGLSPKGPEPGNASYYYSIVQQQAGGTVEIQGRRYEVSGLAWKDHEYSTSALPEAAVGWDWFSLQFDDGSALMLFEIRRDDGSLEPASSGTFIHPDGSATPLRLEDWQLEVLNTWSSPDSGADYPAGWRLSIPSLDLEATGRPLSPNQELNVSTVYWEGATSWQGRLNGQPITAQGYVELTGYAEDMTGRI
jgi:predicted secreted hydrolase